MTMPLTGVVLFAVVLTALSPPQCEAATEYYVRPSHVSDTSCPGEPCLTWTEYVSHTDQYFHSNTTFWFMPGTHHMNTSVHVSNVSNIVLVGLRDLPKVIGNISCRCADTPCKHAGFTINNATNIALKMLNFSIYLCKNNTAEVGGLSFFNVSFLHIEYCNVAVRCNSAINITYSTHVKLNYVHVLNTHHNGIYFLNTTYSSIADCIIHSNHTGISLLNSSAISVMNSFLTGSTVAKVHIKSTTNSSVTNVVAINTKKASVVINKATNITVNITAIISPHSSSNTTNLTDYVIIIVRDSKMVYVYNVTYSVLRVERCQNVTLGSTELSGNQGRKIYFESSSNILFQDCHFTKFVSPLLGIDVTEQPAVIEMYNNSGVTFSDSSFEGNKISCLKLVDTNFTVNGTLIFKDNRAYRGAAIVFIQNSVLIISHESTIEFLHNTATTTGGAIHIVSSSYYVPFRSAYSPCFLEVKDKLKTARLIFKDNSASQGGDALYGGSLGVPCSRNHYSSKRSNKNKSCLQVFHDTSTISPKGLSRITSDPSRVCFCKDGSPECLSFFHSTNFMVYSGQQIKISAGVVGQNFGTVAGSVHAHFLSPGENDTNMTLGEKEQSQGVRKCECRNLTYTILSHSNTTTREVLVLTAVNKQETQLIPPDKIESAKANYSKCINQNSAFLLNSPIYINITLLPCPPGFSNTINRQCDCNEQLKPLPDIMCDIQTLTIKRNGQVWVGAVIDMNSTITHVITSSQCPLSYCREEDVNIYLSQPDLQCNYNRSGILCGQCLSGLSLVLGSNQCLECSNTHLALLVPFALAGVVLVFFIKILDLTIAQGFVNGFIFYANVIKANEHLLIPQGQVNPLTLFISWLNLDLGIETCFFDGLNTFTKTLLQLVFPLYVWVIVWLIILFSRYSSKIARAFGKNSVPVLATLFLLSYSKLIQLIVTALSYTFVEFPYGKKTVWSSDGNIEYLENPHLVLFIAAVAIFVFLWLPYTLLMLTAQWLQKYNLCIVTSTMNRIKPFLDAHYGPLKDKHRYWFGALLLTRVAILLLSELIPSHNFGIVILIVVTASFILTGLSVTGPYTKHFISGHEVSLFINLGLLATIRYQTHIAETNKTIFAYLLIGIAFLQFITLIIYRAYCSLTPWMKVCFYKCHKPCTSGDDGDEGENDGRMWRYNNPLELREVSAHRPLISNPESSRDRDTASYVEYAENTKKN